MEDIRESESKALQFAWYGEGGTSLVRRRRKELLFGKEESHHSRQLKGKDSSGERAKAFTSKEGEKLSLQCKGEVHTHRRKEKAVC